MKQVHSNNWDKLTSPARPSVSDINSFKSLIPEGPILLLGVTPEIANAYDNVLAVDRDIKMIQNILLDKIKVIEFISPVQSINCTKSFVVLTQNVGVFLRV